MTYITRGDGEHFVIPSYRDVLTAKQKTALKNEILALSKSYGEYITLQRKTATKYEVAFSTDRGYLLGESIWHFFGRPLDMVYCEAIQGTTEAILVIVKSGSVYLDGSFPLDTIPEELVVFLTEQNNFEIFISGDVPISQQPEDGKFSFDPASVKKFTVLEKPIFPTLPLLKPYLFDLVDTVLKNQGIGVFPVKQVVGVLVTVSVVWMIWSYFSTAKVKVEAPPPPPPQVNPYQGFLDGLSTPTPDSLITIFLAELQKLYGMPGWVPKSIFFSKGLLSANVQSQGSLLKNLYQWAKLNNAIIVVRRDGISVTLTMPIQNRPQPKNIYSIKKVLVQLIDKIAIIYPGNHLSPGETIDHGGSYSEMPIAINLDSASPELIRTIGQQLQGYPMTLQNIQVSVNNGSLSGSINLLILGS